MTEETVTVTREHSERLKNERLVLFGENSGKWSDEELESNAIQAAEEAVGNVIEREKLSDRPVSKFTVEQYREMIRQAAWAYMQVYVDYVPF